LVVWHWDLHDNGFVAWLVVGEVDWELAAMVMLPLALVGLAATATLPPLVRPALVELVAKATGFGAGAAGFGVPLAWLADWLPPDPDCVLIPENAYQKKETLTTIRTAQVNERFMDQLVDFATRFGQL
jgi:hypothetical protein